MRLELRAKSFRARPVPGALALEVAADEGAAPLGPSGIGKTTPIGIVAGLDREFQGRLEVPERLAMMFQGPELLPWRTALMNVTLPTGADRETAGRLMAEVGFAGREAGYPRQLSRGRQRRLGLARAFAAKPQILLMDEPFASPDAATGARMPDLTARLLDDSGAGLILVTRDPAEAARLSARSLMLAGSPAALADPGHLS